MRAFLTTLIALAVLPMPAAGETGCVGPLAEIRGSNRVAPGEDVSLVGHGWADAPCCDTGPAACEGDIVPYTDLKVLLNERASGADTVVARGVDAGPRGRVRVTFRIPPRLDEGPYGVWVTGDYYSSPLRVERLTVVRA